MNEFRWVTKDKIKREESANMKRIIILLHCFLALFPYVGNLILIRKKLMHI
jgi:hypothetical protein